MRDMLGCHIRDGANGEVYLGATYGMGQMGRYAREQHMRKGRWGDMLECHIQDGADGEVCLGATYVIRRPMGRYAWVPHTKGAKLFSYNISCNIKLYYFMAIKSDPLQLILINAPKEITSS